MPTEQTQVEYYHYYRASQKRVQQWIQNTSRELEAGTASRSSDLPLVVVGGGGVGEGGGKDAQGSAGSRRSQSQSRRRSSSSKDQIDNSSRSRGSRSQTNTRKKPKTTNNNVVRSRTKPSSHYSSSDGLTASSLFLSLGLFPLIFVLTPPSLATLFSATILLAGYFSLDYSKKESISEKL